MDQLFRELTRTMARQPGASDIALTRLRAHLGPPLPSDYLAFLTWSNGASGVIGPNVLDIWTAEDVVAFPQPFQQIVPGVLLIADTGGALFGFDLHTPSLPIVVVDYDDVSDFTPRPLTDTFTALLTFMATENWIIYYSRCRLLLWETEVSRH